MQDTAYFERLACGDKERILNNESMMTVCVKEQLQFILPLVL